MIEFGPREMTIALGSLVVLATMLHIVRDIRNARYQNIQMPSKKSHTSSQDNVEQDDGINSNFPNGRSRVVGYRNDDSLVKVDHMGREVGKVNDLGFASSAGASEHSSPDFYGSSKTSSTYEPDVNVDKKAAPPRIIILHLMAKEGSLFQGEDLLDVFLSHGLRYGVKKIFHFHEEESGSGSIVFSLANAVKPGTFDLDEMSRMATSGISLFFAMEDLKNPMAGLDVLLNSAKNIAIDLNGELKDESRSVFTGQTEEHYRQRIVDYSRTQISGA